MNRTSKWFTAGNLAALLSSMCLLSGGIAQAQYHVTENGQTKATDTTTAPSVPDAAKQGPRFARFSYVSGNVTTRNSDNDKWSKAHDNGNLVEGSQVWTTDGGRAEIRFDDGSVLRIGSGTTLILQSLTTDKDGKFTGIELTNGVAALRMKQSSSVYQIQAQLITVNSSGPGEIRVGAGDGSEVAVRSGRAAVEGAQGKVTLHAGNYLSVHDASSEYAVTSLPHPDAFDRWNAERDGVKTYATGPVIVPSVGLGFYFGGGGYWGGWHHWRH